MFFYNVKLVFYVFKLQMLNHLVIKGRIVYSNEIVVQIINRIYLDDLL